MRSSLLITVLSTLVLIASGASATTTTQPLHHRPTATVEPNGTSCPIQSTPPTISPGKGAAAAENSHDNAIPRGPVITGNTVCSATDGDAATNIARGNALAKPEPLNSLTLITPRH